MWVVSLQNNPSVVRKASLLLSTGLLHLLGRFLPTALKVNLLWATRNWVGLAQFLSLWWGFSETQRHIFAHIRPSLTGCLLPCETFIGATDLVGVLCALINPRCVEDVLLFAHVLRSKVRAIRRREMIDWQHRFNCVASPNKNNIIN